MATTQEKTLYDFAMEAVWPSVPGGFSYSTLKELPKQSGHQSDSHKQNACFSCSAMIYGP